MDPVSGSLVYQLPGGVTLAYDLRLGRTIARWKDISEEQLLIGRKECHGKPLAPRIAKKHRLGPQNGPGSLGTEKL